MNEQSAIDKDRITEFYRRHAIKRLATFGSTLRDDFRPDSDVDILVDFEPRHAQKSLRLFDIAELPQRIRRAENRPANIQAAEPLFCRQRQSP